MSNRLPFLLPLALVAPLVAALACAQPPPPATPTAVLPLPPPPAPPPPAPPPPPQSKPLVSVEFTSLRLMHEKGIITQAEFDSAMHDLEETSGARAKDS